MAIRYLKIVLVGFVALLALMYGAQNLANLDAAYGAVAAAVGMEGHAIYPDAFGPSIKHPALVWLSLALILVGEFSAGALATKGAWDLWRARRLPASDFHAAKTSALLGCGIGLVVWLGLFSVIGGAYFQMWQTQAGSMSLEGAFQFLGICGLVLIFVNMRDD